MTNAAIFIAAEIVGAVCFVTAMLDMGMNGGRNAGWAPWGLGMTAGCFIVGYMVKP